MKCPWPLTPAQIEAFRAVCTYGDYKVAADRLGLSTRTVEHHLENGKRRMQVRGRIKPLIEFDRWDRCQSQATTTDDRDTKDSSGQGLGLPLASAATSASGQGPQRAASGGPAAG